MAEHYEDSRHEEVLGEILDPLERGDFHGVRRVLDGMHPADIAVLMPVVASMGGIAGSQTLTIVSRGMALGQIAARNVGWLLGKELAVGLLNSLCWALVVGAVAWLWFGDPGLGVIVGCALVINLVVAALAGASIPLLLRRLLVDPALAGVVVLTTVTDVVGFMTFPGLGALFLI